MSNIRNGLKKVEVGLRWDPSPLGTASHDLDVVAATYTAEDRYGAPAYLVHFDSRSPDGTIRLGGYVGPCRIGCCRILGTTVGGCCGKCWRETGTESCGCRATAACSGGSPAKSRVVKRPGYLLYGRSSRGAKRAWAARTASV